MVLTQDADELASSAPCTVARNTAWMSPEKEPNRARPMDARRTRRFNCVEESGAFVPTTMMMIEP